ncbi:glycoside hydrolase [Nibricoccus aquaticus]|uniref:Glycoside hydrolase n=1 Tax=Nibricoccus aquaticus TaxID=2576891 RepID=A0A290QMH4_9BACT|nr:trehalase family glycosidase [Nibricoccus aquaticus]ATC65821.1 glycoside hydrolase [Nibricoccus aquaticus]
MHTFPRCFGPLKWRMAAGLVVCLGSAEFLAGQMLSPAAPEAVSESFATSEGAILAAALLHEADQPSKAAWKPMLQYLAQLHGRSVRPAAGFFKYPYESIGPGYMGGRAFGHWDLTQARLDTVRAAPEHVRRQTLNELAGQQADGLIPGVVTFGVSGHPGAEVLTGTDEPTFKNFKGFPPFWVVAVDAYVEQTGDVALLRQALDAARKQIGWFEANRSVAGGGFYYLDVVKDIWESGVDEGVRFLNRPASPEACIDATAHLYLLYARTADWSRRLGEPDKEWQAKADTLRTFIQTELWDPETGFFYDRWSVRDPKNRHLSFEGMWPVVTGAATPEQARRVIEEHLLNPKEFFAPHPITTVAMSDSKFELRMWRGPVWNCMAYWAARGCARYDHAEGARKIMENALDATAAEFSRSGTLWEFYHPMIGSQSELKRKPSGRNEPCRDYVGHNPLFAMVQLWRESGGRSE